MKKTKLLFAIVSVATCVGLLTSCGGNANKDKAKIAANALSSENAKFLSVKSQLELPALITQKDAKNEPFDATVQWVADPADRWTVTNEFEGKYYATPKLPDLTKGESIVEFKMTATVKVGTATAKKEFTGKLIPTEPETEPITIAAAKALGYENQDVVTVEGIMFNNYSNSGFNVCDTTGCISVYDREKKVSPKNGVTFKVTGTMGANMKKVSGLDVPCIQIIYEKHEVVDVNIKPIVADYATSYSVQEVKNWLHNPADENYINRAGEVIKMTGKISGYRGNGGYENVANGGYTNWQIVPASASSPYISFYCNSSVAENYAAFQEFFSPFENKKVEAIVIVHDTNGSNWRFSVLDLKVIA